MINTLIVDDSALARDIIRDFLESEGSFNIIGEAADGEEGIAKILSLNPDLVTLDIEMPKKNGLEVIDAVAQKTAVPIVVITSHDTAKTAYEATVRGALEFYPKNIFTETLSPEKSREIYETLKRISAVKAGARKQAAQPVFTHEMEKRPVSAAVIASSTGGPKALSEFFSLLPGSFSTPIVIVQHNSSGFDKSFAQWLDTFTALQVQLAQDGEIPLPGRVYIAPTDKHLEFRRGNDGECLLRCSDGEPENNQKPAADVLFRTAAKCFGPSLVSVVLTGMGNDGAAGTRAVRQAGGITLAQDEASSLIYGMPKAAAETGCVDTVLPLDRIPAELARLAQ